MALSSARTQGPLPVLLRTKTVRKYTTLHQTFTVVVQEQLLKRLQADSTVRPLLQTEDPALALSQLLAERQPLYAEADLTVVINDETPDTVADGILQLLPSLLKDPTQRPSD